MHSALRHYISAVKRENPGLFYKRSVLELGSLNINGSVREFFEHPQLYVGVDWRSGPDVDVVSLCHELALEGYEDLFGFLISCEMLEHDPYWRESLARGVSCLAEGGDVLLSWATPKREPHEIAVSPTGVYYAGLESDDVEAVLSELGVEGEFSTGQDGADGYFFGVYLG